MRLGCRDVEPGKMHDLRSASVNNTRLAIVAAWHRLHPFLRYFSNRLFGEIAAFLDSVKLAKKGDVSAIRNDTLSRRMCMKQVLKLSWSLALLAGKRCSTKQANAAQPPTCTLAIEHLQGQWY